MEKQETANDKRVHRIRIFENKRDRKPGLYRLSVPNTVRFPLEKRKSRIKNLPP